MRDKIVSNDKIALKTTKRSTILYVKKMWETREKIQLETSGGFGEANP
jgi:hypothetical protein